MKTCSACNETKENEGFYNNVSICKECRNKSHQAWVDKHKEHLKKYRKQNYHENREKRLEVRREHDSKNKDKISAQQKQWYLKNRECSKKHSLEYYHDHRADRLRYKKQNHDKILKTNRAFNRLYRKRCIEHKPGYKLRGNVSQTIRAALKKQNSSKCGKSIFQYLPYTIEELKRHLELQFETNMTWKNYGKYCVKTWDDNDQSTWTWNLDHIIPRSDLTYVSMEDENFQKCWALKNLRPLWSKQNVLDGARRIRRQKLPCK